MNKLSLAMVVSALLCFALAADTGLARGPALPEPGIASGAPVLEAGIVAGTPAVEAGNATGSPAQQEQAAAAAEQEAVAQEQEAVAQEQAVAPLSYQEQNQLVGQFCLRCHNDTMLRGGLSLEGFDAATVDENAEVAEKMIRKLRAGMMPPRPSRRPEDAAIDALVAGLEKTIDESAADRRRPGSRTFQRLNRAEYAASVKALLGVDIDVATFLPPDTVSASFDNIADVQMPSATVMEGYLRAAGHVSRVAVGDPHAGPDSTSYPVPRTASQKERVEGAPIGTRGGVAVVHNFPADGKYEFRMLLHGNPDGVLFGRTVREEQLEVSIDGERVALVDIDRWMSESDPGGLTLVTDPIYVRAGARRVAAAFIKRVEGPEDDLITPIDHTLADTQIGIGYGVTTLPHLRDLAVVGPFEVTGVSDNPSRRRIFTCRPTAPDEEAACAESIITRLAAQAYRRPLNETDVAGLMAFYEMGAADSGFENGIRTALQAILASPHFVFRMEEVPGEVGPGGIYRITDVDLASRLAFFLWGTPPDQELVDVAQAGELSEPGRLEAQVERMLADPRAEGLATRFAAQWLRLQDLDKVHPDALSFPYYDHTLAEAMYRETELLFEHVVREDLSVLELLTADYTFVNERLARHYGIPGVTGPEFRKVSYTDEHRRGILGHGSILTMTSHGNRTSPVLRGKWILEVLLGSPPPPPPPNVPDLEETGETAGDRFLSVAEQLAEHRSNPACSSCHNVIDPLGLALDNYDVTGAWRIKDRGVSIDASGQLYDGTELNGPEDLRAALLSYSDVVITHFTESLMAYALGRRVEYTDMPTIREIVAEAEKDDYRISSFILGIVNSDAFQMNRVETVPEDASADIH